MFGVRPDLRGAAADGRPRPRRCVALVRGPLLVSGSPTRQGGLPGHVELAGGVRESTDRGGVECCRFPKVEEKSFDSICCGAMSDGCSFEKGDEFRG